MLALVNLMLATTLHAQSHGRFWDVARSTERAGGITYQLMRMRVPLSHARFAVHDIAMRRELDDVLRQRRAELVFNAGFYGMQGEVEGLVISGGQMVSPWRRATGGGVLAISRGRAFLFDGELEPTPQLMSADFALQCRPRLVVDRNANIRSDDGRRADRTAMCIRDGGTTLDVFIARADEPFGGGGPTLYNFSRLLVERGCENALNLDGGPSTSAAYRTRGGVVSLPPRTGIRQVVFVTHASR